MSLEEGALVGTIFGASAAGIILIILVLILFRKWMLGPTKGSDNPKSLDGLVAAVTGANTGIGKEVAQDLALRGAKVLILCRNTDKANKVAAEITKMIAEAKGQGQVVVYQLDLSSLASVRQCASEIADTESKIDFLINNAGVMMCPGDWKTDDGFDMQFGTNHLGHFLLDQLLLPLLKKSVGTGFRPRIVITSSLAHSWNDMNWDDLNWEKSYDARSAYGQSKLANVLHAKELARRLEEDKCPIGVYVLHPGVVATELVRHLQEKWYVRCFWPLVSQFIKTSWHGAQTTLYCTLDDEIGNETGQYYSDCHRAVASSAAENVENQKRLWQISEILLELTNDTDQ